MMESGARVTRPPDQIWGQYNNYRANGVAVSAMVHVAVIGLLLSGIFVSHQVTQRATHENVTLIAPSPDTYALPVAKKVISGGGGGGELTMFFQLRKAIRRKSLFSRSRHRQL